MRSFVATTVLPLFSLGLARAGQPYNTFDGPGFEACHDVAEVKAPKSVAEMAAFVKEASKAGRHVRAAGGGHMWYDTMCSDDPNTIIVQTGGVNGISDLQLNGDKGTVVVEAGATFSSVAAWLHERGASLGYTLVNWNITIGGAIAMGAHRSSLREDSQVSTAAVELDIINGQGDIVHLTRNMTDDRWLAATTSLGLLGIVARAKIEILKDFKVSANQITLDEDEVLNGDEDAMFKQISPYVTANYWWWPGPKKFHLRSYSVVPTTTKGDAYQNTFSVTKAEADIALSMLNIGQNLSSNNFLAEGIFYVFWRTPNFKDKNTNIQPLSWPVTGYAYDVLIGGPFKDQKPEWDYGLHGYTLELAVPVNQGAKLLRRVRQLFDQAAKDGKPVTATYRSGINIKFGKPFESLLGQTGNEIVRNKTADWSKGAMMFDFPSFHPTGGGGYRYNELFYHNLAKVLIDEFPTRPHWTKNTREVFTQSIKNLDQENLKRFAKVRAEFDPQKTFKSVVGEIIGVV